MAAAAVTKKLAAGAAGTRRLLARFGAALVCVRYRGAAAGTRRYTTVELVVDERPGKPDFSLVRIDYRESTLRQQVKAAGGVWDARKKLWHLPRTAVRHLGLKDRVVADNGQIRKTGHA
ncbi:MAG: hypothetical protein HY847_04060 [Betaproteobacteria bacterium]|nr:hypothetical protein [Betaproteobacteria bacterium]